MFLALCVVPGCGEPEPFVSDTAVLWSPWDDDTLERADRADRLVLLNLGTQWCHWCHVMDETTYAAPGVLAQIDAAYLPVRVDADSHPLLAARYEDYGWPATIVLAADGTELAKLRGYVAPERFESLLAAFADDPTPGPSIVISPQPDWGDATVLDDAVREQMLARFAETWDEQHGGWGTVHKYLSADLIEWSIHAARRGDEVAEQRALVVLDAQRRWLHDPVWGGVYQYSDSGRWDSPHFEKLMAFQAANLRVYAAADEQWPGRGYGQAAVDIERYIDRFLTAPSGAFYASQDADLVPGEHAGHYFALNDGERMQQGVPRVDTAIYARDNGLAIEALARSSMHSGRSQPLTAAIEAAQAVLLTHQTATGGFSHRAGSETSLGDTVAMGRALLTLYQATGDSRWLAQSERAAEYVDVHFRSPLGPGFVSAESTGPVSATMQRDENIALARWANLLWRTTEQPEHQALAEATRRYLFTPEIALQYRVAVGGLLLVDYESKHTPVKVRIAGDGSGADALQAAAMRVPEWYKVVSREPDGEPVAWVCAQGVCSAPLAEPLAVRSVVDAMVKPTR